MNDRVTSEKWLQPVPAGSVASRLVPTGKKGRPVADNETLADLRRRYPQYGSLPPVEWHGAIARDIKDAFEAAWCQHLGVSHVRIGGGAGKASKLVTQCRPDLLVELLSTAVVTPRRGEREGVGEVCSDCEEPLDANDRTYCRSCKSKRNTAEAERRRSGESTGRRAPELPSLGTFEAFTARVS